MASSYGKMFVNAILGAIAGQWVATIKTEVEIVKVELKYKSRQLGAGVGLVAAAAILAFWMLAVLIAAAVLGLSNVVSPWLAALIVAGGLLFWILVFGLWGAAKIKKNKDIFPAASIERIKDSF
ncbi:phage holin family protein [Demequina sp. NBRC 110056]|uniref:phage holin family protein n=1 Tax=Demequina sp. NBRC 110056 TaxID=1570345 RepID=UPI000A0459B6|nr:phage holin family protein [Demequina sp. NBRC 110056]